MDGPLEALVTCADTEYLDVLASFLEECGLTTIPSSTVKEAQAILTRRPIRLVFCEDGLPDGGFREILDAAKRARVRIPVVVMSNSCCWDHYLRAMHRGAFDYIKYPPCRAEVEWVIQNVFRPCKGWLSRS